MVKTRILIAAILTIACSAFGDEAKPNTVDLPKSDAALSAMKAHNDEVKAAKDAYQQALTTANQKYLDDLTVCLRMSAKMGDTDEVKRIGELIKVMRAKITAGVLETGDNTASTPAAAPSNAGSTGADSTDAPSTTPKPATDAPKTTPVAITTDQLRARIIKQRLFDYSWDEHSAEPRTLEFLSDGTIGQGSKEWEQHWDCAMTDGTPTITLNGLHGPVTLTLGADGAFHGVWPGSTAVTIRAVK